MAWRDELQPASFRGVPFHVLTTGGQLGRRTVVHEYPKRDLPYAEDLGRKARDFTLEAIIIGDDYMAGRDRLIDALEKSGPGELVHPYRGRLSVAVMTAQLSESTDKGGLAQFNITFIESGENLQPDTKADTRNQLVTAADSAQFEIESEFSDAFSIDGASFLMDSALNTVSEALADIQSAANTLLGNLTSGPAFLHQIQSIAGQAGTLLQTPANLASSLYGQIYALGGMGQTINAGLSSLNGLFNWAASPDRDYPIITNLSTPSSAQQTKNTQAVQNLIRQAAVVESTRQVSGLEFKNRTDAILLRNQLADQIDVLLLDASDSVYAALNQCRVSFIRHVEAVSLNLQPIVYYTPQITEPALVIAYRLYADATRDAELINRNLSIHHPGFVRGQNAIEVIDA